MLLITLTNIFSVTRKQKEVMDFTTFYNIIAGQRRSSSIEYSGTSPITGSLLWSAPVATSEDVDDAVAAARLAFPSWAARSYKERTQLLSQFADRYLEHSGQFIELLKSETGRDVRIQFGYTCCYQTNKYSIRCLLTSFDASDSSICNRSVVGG